MLQEVGNLGYLLRLIFLIIPTRGDEGAYEQAGNRATFLNVMFINLIEAIITRMIGY